MQEAQLEERELKAELMKQGYKDTHISPVCYIHTIDMQSAGMRHRLLMYFRSIVS